MKYPQSIQNLIDIFSRLPTVGPKTAERYVFYLLKQNSEELQKFAQSIAELKEKIKICEKCFAISETNPCGICSNSNRDKATICVVSNTRDMISIESTKNYNGVYHVLGGVLNAIEGIKPEELNIKKLLERMQKENIKEIILGLNPTLEGETTSMYLAKTLKLHNIKITRLAKGLPMGSDLEYADEITLTNALKYRNEL